MEKLELLAREEEKTLGQDALSQYEARLLRGTTDTFRGLDDHEEIGERINFRAEIRGKKVCDLGSGTGGLAKTAYAEGIDTDITSVNPSLARSEFKQTEEKGTAEQLRLLYPGISDEEIQAVQQKHDRGLVTAFAHRLPFENDTFDLVVDTNAVHMYLSQDERHLYPLILYEMLRILKPGGKIIIDDGYKSSIGQTDEHGKKEFKEDLLMRIGVKYEIIYSKRSIPLGAILYKD